MRGKRKPPPVQPESAARPVASRAAASAFVPALTLREYHAVRVLMSVLLTAAAPMRISTSPAAGVGTGTSSRNTSCS